MRLRVPVLSECAKAAPGSAPRRDPWEFDDRADFQRLMTAGMWAIT
jgi:hypothetical protein